MNETNLNLASAEAIRNLPWSNYSPAEIMYVNMVGGQEFTQSLRLARELFPDNELVMELVDGELNTKNIKYDSYTRRGDHPDFLAHFFLKYGLFSEVRKSVMKAGVQYLKDIKAFSAKERAMSVFSRENELPEIFQNILDAHPWRDSKELEFYHIYLAGHIEIDSAEHGHGEIALKIMEFDKDVLEKYYTLRLELYKSLEK